MPGKKAKRTTSGGGSPPPVSRDEVDSLMLQLAAFEARVDSLQKQVDALTKEKDAVTQERDHLRARLQVSEQVIAQLRHDKGAVDAENTELRARPAGAGAGAPMPESDKVEQLLRAANTCKVVVFPRGASTTSEAVCFQLRAAAGLPDYATAGAFKAGSVWIVSMINRKFTIDVLKSWYSFSQLTRWGLDQALTKKQLAERAANKGRFQELKAAGAFPRWHGSDIFVRLQAGVRPAAQWDPQLRVPPRPRAAGAGTGVAGAAAPAAAAAGGGGRTANGAATGGRPPASAAAAPPTAAASPTGPTSETPSSAAAPTRGSNFASTSTDHGPFPGPPQSGGVPPATRASAQLA
jgi:hypothetical protein